MNFNFFKKNQSATDKFIADFCQPTTSTRYLTRDEDIIRKDWQDMYKYLQKSDIDWYRVAEYLQNYRNTNRYNSAFLCTPYWYICRNMVLLRDNFLCQLDYRHNNSRLHVHHKTYEFHGREAFHLDSLSTLCEICHGNHSNDTSVKPQGVNASYAIDALSRKAEEIQFVELQKFLRGTVEVTPEFENNLDAVMYQVEYFNRQTDRLSKYLELRATLSK